MRGGEEVKISKRAGSYRHRARADRRGGPRRDALLLPHAEGATRSSSSTSISRARSRRRIRCTTSRWRTRGCPASSASARSTPRVGDGHRRRPRRARRAGGAGADEGAARLPGHRRRAPSARSSRIAWRRYLHETARLTHHLWYHKHHVLNEPEAITRARLVLARAARAVLRNGLALLGITAPDRM